MRPGNPACERDSGYNSGWLRLSLRCMRCARLPFEPRLRRREAREAGNCRREIDRFPLRVEAGDLQLVDPREQMVDEAGDALVSGSSWLAS